MRRVLPSKPLNSSWLHRLLSEATIADSRQGGAGRGRAHCAFPWCFPYLASPKATFRQCSFHGDCGSFPEKSPEPHGPHANPAHHASALAARGALLLLSPLLCCRRCCCPLLHAHPPTSALPQLHVLNVLHTCMRLELGNRCTVLVVAVPARLRCLPLPATTPMRISPACTSRMLLLGKSTHTHHALFTATWPTPHARAAQSGATRARTGGAARVRASTTHGQRH